MASKSLRLRRPDQCVACSAKLPAGVVASWDSSTRTVKCTTCAASVAPPGFEPPLDRGRPGASLAREYERRRTNRERRTRDAHPQIGGLLLALSEGPQHERAFQIGEQGELDAAELLAKRVDDGQAILLHNRRMPGGRGDIDHIAIVRSGVYVIDAKALKGKVEIRKPWFDEPELWIKGYNRTKLIAGLDRQVRAVRDALTDADVPVQGALCFTKANLPLVRTLQINGHLLLYPRPLAKRLNASGPYDRAAITGVARSLAAQFPQA